MRWLALGRAPFAEDDGEFAFVLGFRVGEARLERDDGFKTADFHLRQKNTGVSEEWRGWSVGTCFCIGEGDMSPLGKAEPIRLAPEKSPPADESAGGLNPKNSKMYPIKRDAGGGARSSIRQARLQVARSWKARGWQPGQKMNRSGFRLLSSYG